jgi:DNA-binding transcriptional LysR family regulator
MDRQVDLGFVKDAPTFHELQCVDVHTDEMICIASPKHPLASRARLTVKDVSSEQFVLHHLCSATADRIPPVVRTELHALPCRGRAVELREHQGVRPPGSRTRHRPGVTVREELKTGT